MSAGLRSRLLVGTVRHRRSRHTTYDFTHGAWYLGVDLDEVDAVVRRLRALGRGGWWPLQLRDGDHFDLDGLGIGGAMRARLVADGWPAGGWRITLITYPRVLGYVFNPVCFYLCHDADGRLRHVVAEVHNTHGEREVYDFPSEGDGPVYRGSARKRFYVSPFIGPDARYALQVWDDGRRLAITIRETEAGRDDAPAGAGETLVAQMRLERRPLTNRVLLGIVARDPLVTFRTMALIAWHVFRIWRRGLRWDRFRPRDRYGRPDAGAGADRPDAEDPARP